MRKTILFATAFALAVGVASTAALADGDAKKGKRVFNKCKACHIIDATKNPKKIGPNLHGVIGRAAGSVDGFKYSKAMKESGLVWDEATLGQYLANPRKVVKGTRMAFAGLRKDADVADVIAYIKQESSQ